MLKILNKLPEKLYDSAPDELEKLFESPVLIHLNGENSNPILFSCLMHGNETTGFLALQRILNKYRNKSLPRSVSIFIGNIKAASKGLRQLPDEGDFNRIWKEDNPLAMEMWNEIERLQPEAVIDLHNNSGNNPLYCVLVNKQSEALNLGRLFCDNILIFPQIQGTFEYFWHDKYPSITLEAGIPEDKNNIEIVFNYIDSLLNIQSIKNHKFDDSSEKLKIYKHLGTLRIPAECTVGYTGENSDFTINQNLDENNLKTVEAETIFFKSPSNITPYFTDPYGKDIFDEYFLLKNGEIITKKRMIPTMITTNLRIVKSDCLCYMMEECK